MWMSSLKTAVIVMVLSALGTPMALSASNQGGEVEPVPMGALAHAASVLENNTGGKVLEIRVADKPGAPAFEAALAKDNGLLYVSIASPSEDVTEIKVSDLPPWLLNYHLEAYMRSVVKARVPLSEAIKRAEGRDVAPAIGAGIAEPLSSTNVVLAYFVETIKSGKRNLLAVDATTGSFIANPDTVYETRTPVELARRLSK